MPWKHCLLLLLSLLVYAQHHPTVALQSANTTINQATEGCANQKASQLRVLALFDIGQEDEAFFRRQQSRLEETLRHIDTVAGKKGRPPLYGLITFLRPAVVLSGLNSPQAKSLNRVVKQIHALKPRHRANSSAPTKALEVAAELLLSDGNRGGLVLLVHQGKKNEGDSIADAIAASQRLTANGVFLFSIVGEYSEGDALVSDCAKVLAEPADKEHFLEAIQREIHLCTGLDDVETDNKNDGKRKVPEVEPEEQVEKGEHQQSNVEDQLDFGCKNQAPRKVDLLLALDTSGSVFPTFGRQRQLAVDLISALNPTPQQQQLRFGLISFAAQPAIVLPLVEDSDRQLVLDRLRTIEFTGGSTRIAEAAELALAELAKFGRAEALKVLVLISDGHGEEPWKRAQEVGRRLQRTPQLQLFAVSASADFNRAELGLYMGGTERRMFLGQRHLSFVPTLAGLLNNCLSSNGTLPENPENEDKEIGEKSVAEELVIRQLLSNSSAHSSLGNKEVATNESVANIGRKKGTERRLKDQPMEEGSEENEEPNGSIRRDQSVVEESGKEAEEKKEEKAKGGGKRRTPAEQQALSGDCPTDLLFLLDRFSPGGDIFERQLGLAMQLVERLQAADVDQGKARLAAVSFGREPRLEASWEERLAKADFQHRLRAVQPARVQSSFAQAVNLTLQQIRLHRRPSARLLLFVLWSGSNGRNTAEELSRAVRPFSALARTELFAVTVNPAAQLDRLRVLAGDQWHVFLDARAKQFVDQAARILLDCVLPPSGDLLRQGNLPDEEGPTASTGLFSHEPQDSVERVEHLQMAARALQRPHAQNCQNDPIDLFILLHSASNGRHFSAQKRAVMDVLRQAPAEHFDQRIHLFLWVGTRPIHLTKADANDGGDAKVSSLDDALFAVDRMDWPVADETKPALGLADTLAETLAEWTAKGRRVEARPALVLLTDGAEAGAKQKNEADQPTEMEMLKQALEGHAASAFALNFGPEAAEQGIRDLLAGTGNSSDPSVSARQASLVRVFSAFAPGKMARFVDEFRRRVIWCRDGRLGQADSAMPAEKMHRPPKLAGLFVSEGGGTAEEEEEVAEEKKRKKGKDSNKKEEAKQQQSNNNTVSTNTESVPASLPTTIRRPQTKAPPIAEQQATVSNKISNQEEGPRSRRVSLLNSECKVDLMLIIDTSQSVAEEFQQQLQFAVDLVKRLPDQDFGQRVQVGVVSFHRAGRRQFALGELREKQAVLDALLGIQHTGGSTSVVNGINLAIEEVEKRRRKDARLMMVLVSDGNSQDPWADVVATADRLRAVQADVYAVTVSHDYFFRELELYAGNKWFVYIDARIRQFLDEAEMSLVECRSPSVPTATTGAIIGGIDSGNGIGTSLLPTIATSPSTPANIPLTVNNNTTPKPDEKERVGSDASKDCRNDPVDLLFIVDTSTSVERDFYAQKIFALDLVRVLPEQDFARRLSIGLVKFHAEALLQFPFRVGRRRDDVLYEIERIEHTGGQTSLVAGVELALAEIDKSHRPGARLVVVIISDGNSQDEWSRVQKTAQKLRNATRGELFAVTLSKKYAADELLEYTKDEGRIFTDEGVERFLQEVGRSVVGCPEQLPTDGGRPPLLLITPVPSEEAQPTPAPRSLRLLLKTNSTADAQSDQQNLTEKKKSTAPSTGARGRLRGEFARDPGPVQLAKEANSAVELLEDGSKKTTKEAEEEEGQGKCRFAEMDLIIILDASTSRESVFEQQRELALSLIERLPISRGGTHVAMGINSFTNVPVLRQTLGLGRDRKMVRKAIEDIKYRGGSTLTSKAVELAVQDLERGRRKDALQVVVLMNDGMSQDPWDRVLDASKKLAQTGAQRFGVALGEEVDLRELKHYVGDEQRIYRDGSTERFLQDMVALLGANDPECQQQRRKSTEELKLADEGAGGFDFQMDENSSGGCQGPKLDLVVLLDNTDTSDDDSDPKLNSNRYLLLDVLGSLPLGHRVKVAVLSIGGPRLEYTFADPQAPEALFRRIEQIRPVRGKPRYAQAIESGLDYFSASRRPDAKGLMLLVGDGRNAIDSREERNRASGLLKRAQNTLSCHAVASSKQVDEQTLTAFTGSPSRIYAYDRNAEFAHFLLDQASAQTCQQQQQQQQPVAGIAREQQSPNSTENRRLNTKPSVADQLDDANHSQSSKRGQRQRDIARAGETGDINSKLFGGAADGGKLLARGGEKRVGPTVQQVLERLRARERLETSSKEREEKESEEEKEAKKKKADELEAARKARAEERITRLKAEERKKLEQALALAQQNRPQIQLNGVTARPGRKDQQQQRTASGDQQNGARAEVNNSRIQQLQQQTTASSSSSSRGPVLANTTKSSRSRDTTAFPFSSSTSSAPPATAAKTSAALSFNTQQQQQVQQEEEAEEEPFRPGCLLDVLLLIDCSGSVGRAFEREKQLAAEIVQRLRLGPRNARVALIKFAAAGKVRTIRPFGAQQSRQRLLHDLEALEFSDGVTAIHSALQQAIVEYSPLRGARPGLAQPLALVFTDGFGQQNSEEEARLLRRLVPNVYAIGVTNNGGGGESEAAAAGRMAVAREELARISGRMRPQSRVH